MQNAWWIIGLVVVVGGAAALLVTTMMEVDPPSSVDEAVEPPQRRPGRKRKRRPAPRKTPAKAPEPVAAVVTEQPDSLVQARADLEYLEELLKEDRTINEELFAALEVCMQHYLDETATQAFRARVEKALFAAFLLVKVDPSTGENLRDDVNIRAAHLIAKTQNPKLSKMLIQGLEKTVFKAAYPVSASRLAASFDALATLNESGSFDWMTRSFTHAKASPEVEVDRLVAAHRALLGFQEVPGRQRYNLLSELVKTYSGVESQAQEDAEGKAAFWAQIGPGVVALAQHYANQPQDEDGRSVETMAAFQTWYRDHKDPQEDPWRDPE